MIIAYWPGLECSCANTTKWYSATSACWGFGSKGKVQTSEAPRAYHIHFCGHTSRIASYGHGHGMAHWVSVTLSFLQTFNSWSDLIFLWAVVQVSRHVVTSTDVSAIGWGAMCNRNASSGAWTGPRLQWHTNCLYLLAVRLALRCFKSLLYDKHIPVHTDNTVIVAYIKHQGSLHFRCMPHLACHLLLWSQKHHRSFHAVHIQGELKSCS